MEGATGFDVSAITTMVSGVVEVSDVLTIVGAGLGIGVGFFLTWFAVRKLLKITTKAFKGGKLTA